MSPNASNPGKAADANDRLRDGRTGMIVSLFATVVATGLIVATMRVHAQSDDQRLVVAFTLPAIPRGGALPVRPPLSYTIMIVPTREPKSAALDRWKCASPPC